jgi:hypothetical protein
MVDSVKHCPVCESVLVAVPKLGMRTYECSAGHGVGVNILEEASDLQPDEVQAIWEGVKTAPQSTLLSPISGRPMVVVTFTADDDARVGNTGANAKQLTIEVDAENYFGWFSFEELRDMPMAATKNSAGTLGYVGVDSLDKDDGRFNAIFDSLTPADYESVRRNEGPSPSGLSGLFGGIARRVR